MCVLLPGLLICTALTLGGCGSAAGPAEGGVLLTGETMGTTYSVRIASETPVADEATVGQRIAERLEQINLAMSTYVEGSEISQLNRLATGEAMVLSEETFAVLQMAVDLAHDSEGAFDPTVGALVNAWGFGPINPSSAPGGAELAAIQKYTGVDLLTLDAAARSVRKAAPEVQVDLSAIAKGFAVDAISTLLDELGHPSHMVEIGGEVRTGLGKPDGEAWRIGIERPDVGAEQLHRMVPLKELAMASSGNYRNFYVMDGRVFGHTIDPRTAQPVDHEGASVSVIARDCSTADGTATVLMVMGPEEGLRWAEERDVAALFIVHEDGEFAERTTPEFRRLAGMTLQ